MKAQGSSEMLCPGGRSQGVRHDLVMKQQQRQRIYEEGNMRIFLESFNQYSRGKVLENSIAWKYFRILFNIFPRMILLVSTNTEYVLLSYCSYQLSGKSEADYLS